MNILEINLNILKINPKIIFKKSKLKKNPKNPIILKIFGEKTKNLEKFKLKKKSLYSLFSLLKKKKMWKKKCYPLSILMLGGRDSTRPLQSTPFQNPGGVAQALQKWRSPEILVSNIGWVGNHFYMAKWTLI